MLQNLNMSKVMTENVGELTASDDRNQGSDLGGAFSAPSEFRQFLHDLDNNNIVVSQSEQKIILADNLAEPENTVDKAPLSRGGLSDKDVAELLHGYRSVAGGEQDSSLPEGAGTDSETDFPEVFNLAAPTPSELQEKTAHDVKPVFTNVLPGHKDTGKAFMEPGNAATNIKEPAGLVASLPPSTADDLPPSEAIVATTDPGKRVKDLSVPGQPLVIPEAGQAPDALAKSMTTPGPKTTHNPPVSFSVSDKNSSQTGVFHQGHDLSQAAEPALDIEPVQGKGGEILPGTGNNLPPAVPRASIDAQDVSEPDMTQGMAQTIASNSKPATNIVKDGTALPTQPQLHSLYSGQTAGTENWRNEFAAQVRWLGENGIGKAEIHLKPAELGSIEIRIMSANDQTTVNFITSTSAARETIEQSLPRLRELLQNSGLQLSESSVSQQELPDGSGNQKHGYRQRGNGVESTLGNTMAGLEAGTTEQTVLLAQADGGRVDFYV